MQEFAIPFWIWVNAGLLGVAAIAVAVKLSVDHDHGGSARWLRRASLPPKNPGSSTGPVVAG